MGDFPYASAAAFRTALKDRFAAVVEADRRFSLNELQRQFAYDRALARCFSAGEADRWVLKGAGALLARLEQARHSTDIDLYYAEHHAAESEAVSALRRALAEDIGDLFVFEVTRIVELPEAAKGRRVHVTSRLGAKAYAAFHIDVVVGTAMSGEPDLVPPMTPIEITGLVRPPYRAFPVPDHVADKFCATVETHEQAGQVRASSRVKDLVDLALIEVPADLWTTVATCDPGRLRTPRARDPHPLHRPERCCVASAVPQGRERCPRPGSDLRRGSRTDAETARPGSFRGVAGETRWTVVGTEDLLPAVDPATPDDASADGLTAQRAGARPVVRPATTSGRDRARPAP